MRANHLYNLNVISAGQVAYTRIIGIGTTRRQNNRNVFQTYYNITVSAAVTRQRRFLTIVGRRHSSSR